MLLFISQLGPLVIIATMIVLIVWITSNKGNKGVRRLMDAAQRDCPECAQGNPMLAKFCRRCGKKL